MDNYIKCPCCELNYIRAEEKLCPICKQKAIQKNKIFQTQKQYDKLMKRIADEGLINAYMSWSVEEDSRLRNEFRSGMSLKQISILHKRTVGAVGSRLEKLGLIVSFSSPNSYAEYAHEIRRQNREEERIKLENIRAQTKEVITKRKIDRLVHFTQYTNLDSILYNGLLPTTVLDSRKISYICNDSLRYDYYRNAISLSVTNPNYNLLRAFSNDIAIDWAVISINPSLLYDNINIRRIYCVQMRLRKVLKLLMGLL